MICVLGHSLGIGVLRRRATWLLAASAGLPEAVEDGGTQGCLLCAERRQDGRRDRLVHGDEGERELLDADVFVVTRPGLAE